MSAGGLHGLEASIMGKDAWWSVPLALAIGIPMHINGRGLIPIVQALLARLRPRQPTQAVAAWAGCG